MVILIDGAINIFGNQTKYSTQMIKVISNNQIKLNFINLKLLNL